MTAPTPPVITSLTGDKGEDPTDSDLAELLARTKAEDAKIEQAEAVGTAPSAATSVTANAAAPQQVVTTTPPVTNDPPVARRILFHFLEDGFTAWGQVWYRGQEVEIAVPSKHYDLTKDINGVSWLDKYLGLENEMAQARKWGRVMFREGPWPGDPYNDPQAMAAEQARRRQPPPMAIPNSALR